MERYLQQYSHKTKEALFNQCKDTEKKSEIFERCQKSISLMLSELPELVEDVNHVIEAHIEQITDDTNDELTEESEENEEEDEEACAGVKRKADEQIQNLGNRKLRKWCQGCQASNHDYDEEDEYFDSLLSDWDWSSDEWNKNEDEIYNHILKSFQKSLDLCPDQPKLSKNFYQDQETDSSYNDFNFWRTDHQVFVAAELNVEIEKDDLIAIDDPEAQDLLVEYQKNNDWLNWSFWNEFGSAGEILGAYEELIQNDWANWMFWNYFGSADDILAANEEILFHDWTNWRFWNEIGTASMIVEANEEVLSLRSVKTVVAVKKIKKNNPIKYEKRRPTKTVISTKKSYNLKNPKLFTKLHPKQPRKSC